MTLSLLNLLNLPLCAPWELVTVINMESHVYSWNFGKIYLVHFLKFWNLPRRTREISKFQKGN